MMHLDEYDLYERVEGIISAADFIEISEGAQTIFIWDPTSVGRVVELRG